MLAGSAPPALAFPVATIHAFVYLTLTISDDLGQLLDTDIIDGLAKEEDKASNLS